MRDYRFLRSAQFTLEPGPERLDPTGEQETQTSRNHGQVLGWVPAEGRIKEGEQRTRKGVVHLADFLTPWKDVSIVAPWAKLQAVAPRL